MATGARMQQTGRAGEHFVAAELNRKGAQANSIRLEYKTVQYLIAHLFVRDNLIVGKFVLSWRNGNLLGTVNKSFLYCLDREIYFDQFPC